MTRANAPLPEESKHSPASRLEAARARVRAKPGGALGWRIGVSVVGVVIVVVGIVLLPLPGPGWLIIFAGLEILATEYVWAKRLLAFARARVQRWNDWMKRRPRWVRALVGLVGVAFLALVFLAVYLVLYA